MDNILLTYIKEPRKFFSSIKDEHIKYALTVYLLVLFFSYVTRAFFAKGAVIQTLLFYFLFNIVVLVFSSLLIHVISLLLKGKGNLSDAFKVGLYGSLPSFFFGNLPRIGVYVVIWVFILETIGISELYDLNLGKAIFAMFMLIVIFILIFILRPYKPSGTFI